MNCPRCCVSLTEQEAEHKCYSCGWQVTIPVDWIKLVSDDIRNEYPLTEELLREIITCRCPFKIDVAYEPVKEPPLLQCSECHNTESCAGAMARQWNHGRCMHCGGYFRVVRA